MEESDEERKPIALLPPAAEPEESELSEEQAAVVDQIIDWLTGPPKPRTVRKLFMTLGGLAGTGKAQPLDSIVWTPLGPKRMGDIRLGERVSNPDFPYSRVIGIFPQGKMAVYRITLADGQSTMATADHLWKYRLARSPTDWRLATTEGLADMLKRGDGHSPLFPFPSPIVFARPPHSLPLDPYLLGCLLGDGGLTGGVPCLSSCDADLIAAVSARLPFGCTIKHRSQYDYAITFTGSSRAIPNPVTAALRSLGLYGKLSQDKFLPDVYRYLPVSARFDLLRGLMDTDGSVDACGGIEFSSTSRRLALDLQWLIRSVGGKATLSERSTRFTYRGEKRSGLPSFRLYINHADPGSLFALDRKRLRCSESYNHGGKPMGNRVVSIEPAGERECQCIRVDHPNGLYLTDDFVVTHNTFVIRHLYETLDLSAAVMAFTGKAVSVLRAREGLPAETIHSTIYDCRARVCSACGGKGSRPCGVCNGKRQWPVFRLKQPDEVMEDCFIIDEASMISQDLLADLITFGKPMLFVGDHGQLEPIGDDPGLMRHPDFRLETIHRQAAGSAIIRFAHEMRAGRREPRDSEVSGPDLKLGRSVRREDLEAFIDEDAQIICGYNRTRIDVNRRIRERLGFKAASDPQPGEKLIFLRNNRDYRVYNGMIVIPSAVQRRDMLLWVTCTIDGKPAEIPVDPFRFDHPDSDELPPARRLADGRACLADFAYCLTAHKSQGSEWARVLVLEQIGPSWDEARWRYTAASRAAKFLEYHMR